MSTLNSQQQAAVEAEEWRDIEGWEGRYQVSDAGRVRGLARVASRRRVRGRVLSAHLGDDGYQRVTLCAEGKNHCRLVHRLVCRAFHGPNPPPQPWVNHRNGVKSQNIAKNLHWSSPLENNIHALNTGLRKPETEERPRGERNHRAVLTESVVREMRAMLAAGKRISEIASFFQRSWSTTKNAVRGLTWSHLNES